MRCAFLLDFLNCHFSVGVKMSSIVPLPSSYLDSALELPNNTSPSRTLSHSSSASSTELASSPSLYITFKVLQLVNQFRKRVKTRVRASSFCQAFERQAAEHIDYALGKTRIRPSRKTLSPEPKRKVSKRKVRPATTAKPETESTAAKKIEWYVKVTVT